MMEGGEFRIVVSEFLTVDGVFDGATMEEWMFPYQSSDLGDHILAELQNATAMLPGRLPFEEMAALARPEGRPQWGGRPHECPGKKLWRLKHSNEIRSTK